MCAHVHPCYTYTRQTLAPPHTSTTTALNPGGKRVLIDIGCNKGYTSAQFFAMWQPQRGFSPNHLFRYYNNTGRWGVAHEGQVEGYVKLCGNCTVICDVI